ncbi:hypothetical protein B0H19DRAFT_1235361 [Mycena capillaripes]|nr:hypothetical protein B0H19DRAFT_1235361 [Mycena capillaripes]
MESLEVPEDRPMFVENHSSPLVWFQSSTGIYGLGRKAMMPKIFGRGQLECNLQPVGPIGQFGTGPGVMNLSEQCRDNIVGSSKSGPRNESRYAMDNCNQSVIFFDCSSVLELSIDSLIYLGSQLINNALSQKQHTHIEKKSYLKARKSSSRQSIGDGRSASDRGVSSWASSERTWETFHPKIVQDTYPTTLKIAASQTCIYESSGLTAPSQMMRLWGNKDIPRQRERVGRPQRARALDMMLREGKRSPKDITGWAAVQQGGSYEREFETSSVRIEATNVWSSRKASMDVMSCGRESAEVARWTKGKKMVADGKQDGQGLEKHTVKQLITSCAE